MWRHSQLAKQNNTRHEVPLQHSQIPQALLHLMINNCTIMRNTHQNLQNATIFPAYHKYLTKKYKWEEVIPSSIAWPVLTMAINWFNTNEKQTIQKFIHGWLPLQTHLHVQSSSTDKLCPSCRCHPEEKTHFLACNAIPQKQCFAKLHSQLQQLHLKHQVDPFLHQMLWQGITSITTPHNLPNPTQSYPAKYITLFQNQEQIRWDQIFNGRIAQSWITRLTHHSTQTNGTLFYAKVVQILWQWVLEIWKERNKNLHDTQNTYDQTYLQLTVKQIFHDAAQHPSTMALIENQTTENILTRPIKIIRQWVECRQFHMRAQAKAAAIQAKLKTLDIRSFFQPKQWNSRPDTSEKNLLWPP